MISPSVSVRRGRARFDVKVSPCLENLLVPNTHMNSRRDSPVSQSVDLKNIGDDKKQWTMEIRSIFTRLTSFASLLVCVAIWGNSDEVEVLVVDPSWHGSPIPPLTLEDPKVLEDRNARIFDLEAHCRSVGRLPADPAESCIERLDDYFSNVPIWRGAYAMVYTGTRGRGHSSPYDHRQVSRMQYDETDYLQTDVPSWSDIFDGNEEDRLRIVSSVFADRACLALRELGRIQPSYAARCQARELFKYARYLEACMTGFSRIVFFNAAGQDGLSSYERARASMDPTEVVDYRKGNGWQLVENYLLSIFAAQKCIKLHFVAADEYISEASTYKTSGTIMDMQVQIRPMYDASMAIAARAGDPWAIQAYHEKQMRKDVGYWRSVYEINPLLFHRWMSSSVGIRWFDRNEQLRHERHVYALAKEFLPILESVPFKRFVTSRGGRYTDAKFERAEQIVKRAYWKSEIEYPWDLVPDAFKEIQQELKEYEDAQR